MTNITAKVKCSYSKEDQPGFTRLEFSPDYQDSRNQEWAAATPTISISMVVKNDIAEHFEFGQAYTLTFSKDSE